MWCALHRAHGLQRDNKGKSEVARLACHHGNERSGAIMTWRGAVMAHPSCPPRTPSAHPALDKGAPSPSPSHPKDDGGSGEAGALSRGGSRRGLPRVSTALRGLCRPSGLGLEAPEPLFYRFARHAGTGATAMARVSGRSVSVLTRGDAQRYGCRRTRRLVVSRGPLGRGLHRRQSVQAE